MRLMFEYLKKTSFGVIAVFLVMGVTLFQLTKQIEGPKVLGEVDQVEPEATASFPAWQLPSTTQVYVRDGTSQPVLLDSRFVTENKAELEFSALEWEFSQSGHTLLKQGRAAAVVATQLELDVSTQQLFLGDIPVTFFPDELTHQLLVGGALESVSNALSAQLGSVSDSSIAHTFVLSEQAGQPVYLVQGISETPQLGGLFAKTEFVELTYSAVDGSLLSRRVLTAK